MQICTGHKCDLQLEFWGIKYTGVQINMLTSMYSFQKVFLHFLALGIIFSDKQINFVLNEMSLHFIWIGPSVLISSTSMCTDYWLI